MVISWSEKISKAPLIHSHTIVALRRFSSVTHVTFEVETAISWSGVITSSSGELVSNVTQFTTFCSETLPAESAKTNMI